MIATLVHIRMAFMSHNIQFKDCRGDNWFLEVCLGKDGTKPSVVQRRKEQVFKMADNGLPQNLYVFTWEVVIDFDSLECTSVMGIVCCVYLYFYIFLRRYGGWEQTFPTFPKRTCQRNNDKKLKKSLRAYLPI